MGKGFWPVTLNSFQRRTIWVFVVGAMPNQVRHDDYFDIHVKRSLAYQVYCMKRVLSDGEGFRPVMLNWFQRRITRVFVVNVMPNQVRNDQRFKNGYYFFGLTID